VLFFFVMALSPTKGALLTTTVTERTATGTVERQVTRAERDSIGRAMELRARKSSGLWAAALRGVARGEQEPEEARHAMVSAMPKIMFVLVPFFALVTGVAYRRRRLHYPTHLIFALHVFAFYFAVSAIARLVRLAATPTVGSFASQAAVLGTVVYLAIALRRAYGGRLWTTALRLSVMLCLFGMGFVSVIAASALIVLAFTY
jgi:hypothetical protein